MEKNTSPITGSSSFAALRRRSLEGKERKSKEGIQGRHWEKWKGIRWGYFCHKIPLFLLFSFCWNQAFEMLILWVRLSQEERHWGAMQCMHGWMDGWVNEWMNEWMNEDMISQPSRFYKEGYKNLLQNLNYNNFNLI